MGNIALASEDGDTRYWQGNAGKEKKNWDWARWALKDLDEVIPMMGDKCLTRGLWELGREEEVEWVSGPT